MSKSLIVEVDKCGTCSYAYFSLKDGLCRCINPSFPLESNIIADPMTLNENCPLEDIIMYICEVLDIPYTKAIIMGLFDRLKEITVFSPYG